MLRDGTYKEARSLTSDDSLMPGYFDTAPVREGMNPYLRIMQPATGGYDFVHHLADAFNFRQGLAPRFAGPFVRHHKNFNRYDNRPSNIERMDFLAHLHLHAEHAQEMWLDPQFRAAQRAGVQRYYHEIRTCANISASGLFVATKTLRFVRPTGRAYQPVCAHMSRRILKCESRLHSECVRFGKTLTIVSA